MTSKQNYKFKSSDFYDLLEKQDYKCFYTGRELRPENTNAVHIIPLAQGGLHELKNIVLVDKDIYYLKKKLNSQELLKLAKEIVKNQSKIMAKSISKK